MLFPKGTLVMTIAANIGDVAILDFDACFPDSVIGFIPNERLNRDYLYYVFTCMKEELIQDAPVNTQGNLSVERIGPRSIPMPPFTEQAQIVEAIERLIAPIDEAVFRTETEIRLLVEYRARLVADVVIGRLDIRKAALMLLDADTPEAVEEDVELVSSSETIDKELAI
jgi:type I restriction enzyme S subunit